MKHGDKIYDKRGALGLGLILITLVLILIYFCQVLF